jgi:hypothetical protein
MPFRVILHIAPFETVGVTSRNADATEYLSHIKGLLGSWLAGVQVPPLADFQPQLVVCPVASPQATSANWGYHDKQNGVHNQINNFLWPSIWSSDNCVHHFLDLHMFVILLFMICDCAVDKVIISVAWYWACKLFQCYLCIWHRFSNT